MPQILNFKQLYRIMNMLFTKYPNYTRFPKKERTKSLQPLTYFSSVTYLYLCIIIKIHLNLLFID